MKIKQKIEKSQQRISCQLTEIRGNSNLSQLRTRKLCFTFYSTTQIKDRKNGQEKNQFFFLLHDYAFALLGPRIIFLIDSVNERIILLILLYELAHPKTREKKGWIRKFGNFNYSEKSSIKWIGYHRLLRWGLVSSGLGMLLCLLFLLSVHPPILLSATMLSRVSWRWERNSIFLGEELSYKFWLKIQFFSTPKASTGTRQ